MQQNQATQRRFGLELEYEYPEHGVNPLMVVGIAREMDPDRADQWTAGHDGGEHGVELRTPPSTWEHWPTIRDVMNRLRPMGRVCRMDGFHIHLDASDFTQAERIWPLGLWYQLEPAIMELVSASRRNNSYCAPVRDFVSWQDLRENLGRQVDHYADWRGEVRDLFYRRCAFVPYANGGVTFEIRAHQGTMDPRKAKYWLLLFQAFIQASRDYDAYRLARMSNWDSCDRYNELRDIVYNYLPPDSAGRTVAYMDRRRADLQ